MVDSENPTPSSSEPKFFKRVLQQLNHNTPHVISNVYYSDPACNKNVNTLFFEKPNAFLGKNLKPEDVT